MIIDKEWGRKVVLLNSDKNYQQNFPYFIRILRKTRIPVLKKSAVFMNAVQISMLRNLVFLQTKYREAKRELKAATNQEDIKSLRIKNLIFKQWIRVFQTIADGIAWRALKFNRPLIRVFSENNAPGHLDQVSQDYVSTLASYLKKIKYFTLANDLTRCLRIGDLIMLPRPDKPVILELKSKNKKVSDFGSLLKHLRQNKDSGLGKQQFRHWVAQSAALTNQIAIPHFSPDGMSEEIKAEIVNLDFKFGTHFKAIERLIKKADKIGYAHAELEDGYFAKVIAYDLVASSDDTDNKKFQEHFNKEFEKLPSWCKKPNPDLMTISNFDSFLEEDGHYTRNFTPYSIMPLSTKNCVRLMMGRLHLTLYLNLSTLERRVTSQGWQIERLPLTGKKAPKSNKKEDNFLPDLFDEGFYKVSKPVQDLRYVTILPHTELIQMLSSMYKIDFIINGLEKLLSSSKIGSPGRRIAINYVQDGKHLI